MDGLAPRPKTCVVEQRVGEGELEIPYYPKLCVSADVPKQLRKVEPILPDKRKRDPDNKCAGVMSPIWR